MNLGPAVAQKGTCANAGPYPPFSAELDTAGWIGEYADGNNPSALNSEGHDGYRLPVRGHEDPRGSVDEYRPHMWGELPVGECLFGNALPTVDEDCGARARQAAVGPEHGFGMQYRDQG